MLTSLSIDNIVLIKQLRLELQPGLNVLTGETGAGKSILLDSLSLTLGARADAGLLRQGTNKGSVSAVFELPQSHRVFALLEEAGVEVENPLILRRQLKADGASRAFLNDAPVSAGLLKSVGTMLVEIHGQHDERGLLDSKGHLALLDQFAGLSPQVETVRAQYRAMVKARDVLKAKQSAVEAMLAEEEYLKACAEELAAMMPDVGEEDDLAARRAQMQRGIRMLTSLQDAYDQATGNTGPDAQIRTLIRTLARLPEADDERLTPVLDALDRAAIETDSALQQLSALIAAVDVDPGELDSVEKRLFDLRALGRKHNVSVDALPNLALQISEKLSELAKGQTDVSELEISAERARAAFEKTAQLLSKARQKAASALDKAVNAELPPLKMEAARFRTVVTHLPAEQWSHSGADTCQFEVSTNPGSDFGPIIKIASGGELSRFILALKVALAGEGGGQTMIFDEVDRGVGGPTAAAVGRRLGRLSEAGQVIVVTHSPQVAAMGQRHWQISKTRQGDATTDVRLLSEDERREEIARMLSGETITEAARAAARSLLEPAA
ncbi:MAG: DNA repair protein RecN [Pseudomonadota bacterium]